MCSVIRTMADAIELQSFKFTGKNDDDKIEEYHEIDYSGAGGDATDNYFAPKPTHKLQKDFDFFIDVKSEVTKEAHTKKVKKKNGHSDIMDVINTELASNTLPLKENDIEIIENEEGNLSLITKSLFSTDRRVKIKTDVTNLAPIFPKVLENTSNSPLIPVQHVDPVKFDDFILMTRQCGQSSAAKFLNILLNNVKFRSHYSFSLETLLCRRLLDAYDQYTSIQKAIKDVNRNLKVNRFTRDNLKQEFSNIGENSQKDLRFDPTVRKYTKILFGFKEQHLTLLENERKVVHEIISLWSDVVVIREKFEGTEIPVELEVVKYSKDDDTYDKEWTDTLNVEIADLLDKLEYDFVSNYLDYKAYKSNKGYSDYKLDKVKKPKLDIDENEVRKYAESVTSQVVRKDNVRIYIKQNKTLDSVEANNAQTLFDFCFKFYVDKMFICESDTFTVTKHNILFLNIEESFSVQILTHNSTLTIGLCENDQQVAMVKIDLKSIMSSNDHSNKVTKPFTYDLKVTPNANHIGSGHTIKEIAKANKVRLKSSNLFIQPLETVTEIDINTTWDGSLNRNDNIKESLEIGKQIERLLHGVDKPNLDILRNVINHLYTKDIDKDEDLVNQLQQLCKMSHHTDDDIYLAENSEEYTRLKLLYLRNNGGFLNIENKMVPQRASQITTEQLDCLHNSNRTDLDFQYLTDYENADPLEMQRFVSAKYVQNLNKTMLKHLHDHLFKKTQKDVLKEVQDFRGFLTNGGNNFNLHEQHLLYEALNKEQEIHVTVLRGFNLMDRSSNILDEDEEDRIAGYKVRSLRPFVRVSYRGSSVQTATAIGCFPTWNQTVRMKIKAQTQLLSTISINIYDEFKIDIKDNESNGEYSTHSRTEHYRYCYRWMGVIEVPLYAVLSLGTIRGTFKLTTPPVLFGYEHPQPKDQNHSLLPEVNQLMQKDLSFLTLQISAKSSNLNGINVYNQPLPGSREDDYVIKHLNNLVTEYLNDFPTRHLSLTLIDSAGKNKCVTSFLQPIPLPGYENFPRHPKYRTESALSKSSGMSKSSSSKSSSGRRREVDVEKASPIHEEKESVYSAFESTWKEDGQLTKLIDTSARYVALIPTYEVNNSHAVTLMGLELLKLLHGSPLDHTILLASYLLYLGVKSFVAIGTGLPRGRASFVLTQVDLTTKRVVSVNDPLLKKNGLFSKSDGCLWYVHDACSGEKYELRDVSCPLKTVNYVFNSDNIWVNIQPSLDCEHVCFDFSKSADWQPVFDNSIFVMKQPIVTDVNLYSTPVDVEQLQEMLDGKLRAKVQKWRPNTKTVWNRYCSNLLKEVLSNYEYWSFNPTEAKPPLGQKIKQLMLTHKVFGFPLNMAFVNTKSVINTVKQTGIHNNDDPNLEFGLGVQVYAYPNNVLSIWIFLVSISRV